MIASYYAVAREVVRMLYGLIESKQDIEQHMMPSIELIYPAEGKGPLDRLLKQHRDGLVYHMCYTTHDLSASLKAMDKENDLRVLCVSPPKPAILFGGKPVSFYIVSNVGLIEIIDAFGR